MRWVFAFALCSPVLVATVLASTEVRTFVIAIDSGGYGIDRCLAAGSACGAAAARAYCRSRDFADARSFRRSDDITAGIGIAGHDGYVAIECARRGD
jgi:hypothetical protein